MYFSLKTVIPESSELRDLATSNAKEDEFLVEILKQKKTSQLASLLEEVKRYKSKVGTISDHLILRNSQTIIEQAQVVRELLGKTVSSEVHFETAAEKIDAVSDKFVNQYEKMERELLALETNYQSRRLAGRYLKFLESKGALLDIVSKPFDIEKASEAYKRCMDCLYHNQFEGLKFFDEARDQVENSKTLIANECTSKLVKALEELSFTDSKKYLFAFDNLQLMQMKIQEIANKAMRENFALIKEMFTDSLDFDPKDLKGSLEKFVPRIQEIFTQIAQQSQRIWILEVSLYERKSSIKEKDLVSLFTLYFGKLISMIVQTFQKLVENKAKLPVNYELIFLSSSFFMKALNDLANRIYLFIISHPTGYHLNHITIASLTDLISKELPSIIQKEFENIFLEKIEEFLEVRVGVLEEIFSAAHATLKEETLEEINNFMGLLVYLLQGFSDKKEIKKLVLTQLEGWLQGVFDSVFLLLSPEQNDEEELHHREPISAEAIKFASLYKMSSLLAKFTSHLHTVILSLSEDDFSPKLADTLNSHGSMAASLGKRLAQQVLLEKTLTQTDVLEEVCSCDTFLLTLGYLVDAKTWSDQEMNPFRFLLTCRILLAREEADFTRKRTSITASVNTDLAKALEGYELESEEVFIVNLLNSFSS